MNFHVIIPARYQSSRLPGKPLALIGDKTMIEHVCLRAQESGASSVTVATDHLAIKTAVEDAGFTAVMTNENHPSGSDRIYEACNIIGLSDDDIIVNVQGDEPFIPSKNIRQVAGIISSKKSSHSSEFMSTLCTKITNELEVLNPNSVKVIFDQDNKAIYFSRTALPYVREAQKGIDLTLECYYRHIGIYAYTKEFLSNFVSWPEAKLERLEKLEQLRTIENGKSIYLDVLAKAPPAGIDTPDDLKQANSYYQSLGN